MDESLAWFRDGLTAALQRRGKPVAFHLLRVYGDVFRELRREVPKEVVSELHRMLGNADAGVTRVLAALAVS